MSRNRIVNRAARALPLAALLLAGCATLPESEEAGLDQANLLAEYRELLSLTSGRAEERLQRLDPAAGACDRDRLHQAMLRTHAGVERPDPATATADFEPCRASPPAGTADLVAVIDTQLRRASRDAAEIRMLESELADSQEDLEALKELERRLMERGRDGER